MLARITLGCALFVISANAAAGNSDPLFESDARIPSDYKPEAAAQWAHVAVQMITVAGYSCTSVSGIRSDPFHNTMVLICDHNRYEYHFHDLGGHVEISIDDRVIASY